jgi:hypothetical protein
LLNHRYDKNFETIEEIYEGRFSHIYHLVPFYDGDKKNVIPVFGRSIFFESYIAQGFNVFFKQQFKHYFIVADDMILNPEINETNYQEFFGLGDCQSFLPSLLPLHSINQFWIGNISAYFYIKKQKYIESGRELPTEDEAIKRFSSQGIEIKAFSRKELFGKFTLKIDSLGNKSRLILRILTRLRHPFTNKLHLPYPMVGSYSDIAIISSDTIKEFCHYCGVFGATGLFAEVAIPTALVLASKEIILTESQMAHKGRSFWQSKDAIFWKSELNDVKWLDNNFNSLDDILKKFPEECIYLHPVKLSKWSSKNS